MPDPIVDRLANLPNLSKAALAELWEQLFQTSPQPRLRRDLMVRILAHRLQEQAFGGLASGYRRRLQRLASAIETDSKQARGSRLSIKPVINRNQARPSVAVPNPYRSCRRARIRVRRLPL